MWRSNKSLVSRKISVIIAAHNEAYHLTTLIPKLLSQKGAEFEIIVGLDRTSDASIEVLSRFQAKNLSWIDIQEVPKEWNSKKYALKKAIESASGEWLVFTDADCIPSSLDWLQCISTEIKDSTDIVIGVSPFLPRKGILGSFIQFEGFMTYFLYASFTMMGRPYMAVGRNMAIRKDYYQKMNGYEAIKGITGGDDDLFIQKAEKPNIALMLGSKSLMHTYPLQNWRAYFTQKIRHHAVSKYYASKDLFFLTTMHLLHLLAILFILFQFKSKFFLPTILFYVFIKFVSFRFVSGKIGAGFNYMLLPIVDIMYAFMIPVISIWSKLKKDIEWKN